MSKFPPQKFTQLNNFYLKVKIKIRKILFNRVNQVNTKGFFKNPFFYFGFFSFVLSGLLFVNTDGLAKLSYLKDSDVVFSNPFFKNTNNPENNDLFFSQNKALAIEKPDLKIIEDGFIYGISTPRVLTSQTLGDIFGGPQDSREIIEYSVEPGDTLESIAQSFGISLNTLLWTNNLSKNSSLKTGQNLVILPVSGVTHIVKSGDTISEIGKTYKAKIDDILAFNNLTSEGDIFVGDILIVPGGIMPQKSLPSVSQKTLADSFFIYPTEGKITQGLHWYNAIDVANKCGNPINAAASGTVQRVRYGWNHGGGNQVTILHSDGIVSYYGHLMSLFVKPGDKVTIGDRIALMGQTGKATGCHLHFEVIGAKNPLAKYFLGAMIKYK